MDNAVIIGNGFVGKATAKALDIPWHFDLKESNITLAEASKKQFIIFCTPTPTDSRGQQQGVDIIDGYIQQLKELGGRNIFIVRSTVLPGTCKGLAEKYGVMVVSNPEFLSEKTWEYDATHPSQIVIGADDIPSRIAVTNLWKRYQPPKEEEELERLKCHKCGKFLKKPIKFIVTDTVTAETIKYAFNMFMLTKVIWANQIYDICKVNGASYNTIKEMLYSHTWGTRHHLKPIHKGGRGGGGHCFPKDIKAFAKYSNLELFKTIDQINDSYLQKSQKQ